MNTDDSFKEALRNGVVVMKPMSPPLWEWQLERDRCNIYGPLFKTKGEAQEHLEKFKKEHNFPDQAAQHPT